MHYELWETSTGNAIGSYDTEAAALRVVRETAVVHGGDAVRTFALVRVSARGRARTLALGEALMSRANSEAPARVAAPV